MAKRKRKEKRNTVQLEIGFYIVDGNGFVRTQTVVRGKGEERRTVEEPIKFRTVKAAQAALILAGPGHAILYSPVNEFVWGS